MVSLGGVSLGGGRSPSGAIPLGGGRSRGLVLTAALLVGETLAFFQRFSIAVAVFERSCAQPPSGADAPEGLRILAFTAALWVGGALAFFWQFSLAIVVSLGGVSLGGGRSPSGANSLGGGRSRGLADSCSYGFFVSRGNARIFAVVFSRSCGFSRERFSRGRAVGRASGCVRVRVWVFSGVFPGAASWVGEMLAFF